MEQRVEVISDRSFVYRHKNRKKGQQFSATAKDANLLRIAGKVRVLEEEPVTVNIDEAREDRGLSAETQDRQSSDEESSTESKDEQKSGSQVSRGRGGSRGGGGGRGRRGYARSDMTAER